MRYSRLLFFSIPFFLLYACSFSNHDSQVANKFINAGPFVDSLTAAFQCGKITLDRWDGTDVSDSTFSICFINAKKIPSGDVDQTVASLKDIVRTVQNNLKDPKKYNSYQIVFVKADNLSVFSTQTPQCSGVIDAKDL